MTDSPLGQKARLIAHGHCSAYGPGTHSGCAYQKPAGYHSDVCDLLTQRILEALQDAAVTPAERISELIGMHPVVMFFATREDADGNVAAIRAENPNLKVRSLDQYG